LKHSKFSPLFSSPLKILLGIGVWKPFVDKTIAKPKKLNSLVKSCQKRRRSHQQENSSLSHNLDYLDKVKLIFIIEIIKCPKFKGIGLKKSSTIFSVFSFGTNCFHHYRQHFIKFASFWINSSRRLFTIPEANHKTSFDEFFLNRYGKARLND